MDLIFREFDIRSGVTHTSPKLGEVSLSDGGVCENEDLIDTRPPPTGTSSNLEGELWLLLNLINLRVEKGLKTGYNKLDTQPPTH